MPEFAHTRGLMWFIFAAAICALLLVWTVSVAFVAYCIGRRRGKNDNDLIVALRRQVSNLKVESTNLRHQLEHGAEQETTTRWPAPIGDA